jgi:CheY-like chemotaxis protein
LACFPPTTQSSWIANGCQPDLQVSSEIPPTVPTVDEVRIVVVEDHEATRYAFDRLLRQRGYTVFSAATANEALAAVAETNPHCILLDLGLPDIDGADLALLLRARYGSGLVIIAVTGIAERDIHDTAERAGVDFLLQKPLQIDKLMEILPAITGKS